jgi:hypothetical protein
VSRELAGRWDRLHWFWVGVLALIFGLLAVAAVAAG